jgi:hypothetical protein
MIIITSIRNPYQFIIIVNRSVVCCKFITLLLIWLGMGEDKTNPLSPWACFVLGGFEKDGLRES